MSDKTAAADRRNVSGLCVKRMRVEAIIGDWWEICEVYSEMETRSRLTWKEHCNFGVPQECTLLAIDREWKRYILR